MCQLTFTATSRVTATSPRWGYCLSAICDLQHRYHFARRNQELNLRMHQTDVTLRVAANVSDNRRPIRTFLLDLKKKFEGSEYGGWEDMLVLET